jgi:predicted transglutaminase-like cysteine proteinase
LKIPLKLYRPLPATTESLNKAFRAIVSALILIGLLFTGLAIANVSLTTIKDNALASYGNDTAIMIDQWIKMIVTIRGKPDKEKLIYVNNFFNSRIKWISDIDNWKEEDYWATPLETMARKRGDCEDFSISKYITLVLSGMPDAKLRITYVKARIDTASGAKNQAHMVLAYYPKANAEPVILDNIVKEIVRGSLRRDLKPVFGFNTGVITVGHGTKASNESPTNRLSRWGDALAKMKSEGVCLPGEAC